MTPDEMSPSPVDEQLVAKMMAFDALLHATAGEKDPDAGPTPSPNEWDDRGRSRLLLLLKMLEATETPEDWPADAGSEAGRQEPDEPRPLLGRFDVLDNLGSGGFGFVVRPRDRLLGREVALKMPLPERAMAPATSTGSSARPAPPRGSTIPTSSASSTPASSAPWAISSPRSSAGGRACTDG